MNDKNVNYFGRVHFRDRNDVFGINLDDRTRHMYIIGKTGMGKTALLQNMAIQDIINGQGIGVIDPHGDFADLTLDFVPGHRIEDVVYINPADSNFPVGLNLLEDVGYDERHLVASSLMGIFKKIWIDVWSPRMEYLLNNAILALLEYPDATLLDANRLLTNKTFRKHVISHVNDPIVKEFWSEQFVNWGERLAGEATAAIENKIGQFIAAPLIRNIVGQTRSTIDFRYLMDQGKIVVVNLAKGYIGEENSRLLGAMTITKLYLAAMGRVNVPENERRDFVLYVDEFQNFASEAFEGILSEARKYHLSLVLAHQYIEQMDETVRSAVFGNIGTLISFRVGAVDAEYLEKEFIPDFTIEDIVNLGRYHIVLRLMIDGVASAPFSASTLEPFSPTHSSYREFIIDASRRNWTISREQIEETIKNRIQHAKDQKNQESNSGNTNSGQQEQQKLYDAVCEKCSRDTKVVFEPNGSRQVLCRKCRRKKKREQEEKREQEKEQEKSTNKKRPRNRGRRKQEEKVEKSVAELSYQKDSNKAQISLAEAVRKYPSEQKREGRELNTKKESKYITSRPPIEREKKAVDVQELRKVLLDVLQENKNEDS